METNMSFDDKGFPDFFDHPSAGGSELDPRYLAVRWHTGTAADAKQRLIAGARLTPVTSGVPGDGPGLAVNRTDGLWWVQRPDGEPIADDVVDQLQGSGDVDWVAPGYRAAGARMRGVTAGLSAEVAQGTGVYTVNPTRVFVHQAASEAAGAVAALSTDARPSRMRNYVPMRVRSGTALTAVGAVTTSIAAAGATAEGAVRFETIPFFSPAMSVASGPRTATAFTPNDPKFALQWNLQRIKAPEAWQIVRGDPSVVVAVIDEGVELAHPDLDVHSMSWNASNDTADGSPTGNHGTACAGIVAARLDNNLGVAGVAGGAKVMAIATETWADVDIAEGLYFAADSGARVVSMSFGVYPEWGVWDFDLIRDALQHAYDEGLLLVAAAGNEDSPVSRFPGSDSRTLCVGGSNRSDERKRIGDASAESWWGASYGPDVDVVAPALQIPTTDRLGADGYTPDDYVDTFNGTSAATPHVAGLGALMLSLNPQLDNVQTRHLIERTCDKISPNKYPYRNVATKPSGTWHEEVGYGRINAEKAVMAVRTMVSAAAKIARPGGRRRGSDHG
jgi:thermitase